MDAEVEVRPLQALDDLHACENLQQRIWGFQDRSVVPHHLLRTSLINGGVLLGALSADEIVGFVFSFPGYDRLTDRWKHCSLMCGVLPDRQYRGVGLQLKRAQREAVLAQGLDLITWTFDPLQSLNAYFNLTKLGAVVRRYERNIYGDIRDNLNQGLETDRLTAEWWLASPRVERRMGDATVSQIGSPDAESPCLNRVDWTEEGFPFNNEVALAHSDRRLRIEIPSHINAIKAHDLPLAQRWRSETREMFEHVFEQGYIAQALVTSERDGRPRSWYRLDRAPLDELLHRPAS